MDIDLKEQTEINFWKTDPFENPTNFTIQNIINKLSEAKIYLAKLDRYQKLIQGSHTIVEIGSGQGWASCILKSFYPSKHIIASDISKHALRSLPYWEDLFKVKLDNKIICKSYQIPLADESADLAFCFQSAHHFVHHQKTLIELKRILKMGGTVLYLHEPSCRKFLYKLALKRVNKKRPKVPEDILIYKEIAHIARQIGFKKIDLVFDPSLVNRGPLETIYFSFLKRIKILQQIFPTSIDYIFKK